MPEYAINFRTSQSCQPTQQKGPHAIMLKDKDGFRYIYYLIGIFSLSSTRWPQPRKLGSSPSHSSSGICSRRLGWPRILLNSVLTGEFAGSSTPPPRDNDRLRDGFIAESGIFAFVDTPSFDDDDELGGINLLKREGPDEMWLSISVTKEISARFSSSSFCRTLIWIMHSITKSEGQRKTYLFLSV